MKTVVLACAVLSLLGGLGGLGGCASFQGAPPRPESGAALATLDADYDQALKEFHDAITPDKKMGVRNRFVEARAALIDRHYADFRTGMYAERVGSSVGLDIATIGLNMAGVLTSAESAKTAANALAGGLVGSKASVDKNVYFDRTLPALLSQMQAQRNTVRMRMLTGLAQSPERYPLMQAAADLEEYYSAGTLAGAVAAITQQAGTEQTASAAVLAQRLPSPEMEIARLKKAGFDVELAGPGDAATKQLQRCLVVGSASFAANREALAAWMKGKGLDPAPPFGIARFLDAPEFAAQRAAAAADPALLAQMKNCN